MNPFQLIAENKIREAMENGEFDNLPGQGNPVDLSEDEHIPPEYRMAYRIMKNAGQDQADTSLLRQMRALKDEAKEAGADPKADKLSRLLDYREAGLRAWRNR